MGARLTITGRDRGRAPGVASEVRAAGGQVEVFVAGLSSQSEVRRLAGEVLQRLSSIDVPGNNARGCWNTRHVTAHRLKRTFALNYLAPFLLTNLIRAFGVGPGLVVLGAVDLGAAALAAAPTPGGPGAVEAALAAGLAGVGMQAGPAVSAVLLDRLATYWPPALRGWLSWRSLQCRGYV